MTREKFTLTFEFTDSGEIKQVKTATIEQACCTTEDLLEWLPDGFLAIGHVSMAKTLSDKIRG